MNQPQPQTKPTVKVKFILTRTITDQPVDIALEADSTGLLQGTIPSAEFSTNETNTSTESLSFRKLVSAIDDKLGNAIPEDLKISFKQILFITDLKSKHLFGLRLGLDINLSNLPLVGKEFSKDQTLVINNLNILFASDQFPQIPASAKLPQQELSKGLLLSALMQFKGTPTLLDAPISQASSSPPSETNGAGSNNPPLPQAPAPKSSDTVKWIDLKKNFGPLYFSRIGVQYQNSEVWFLLDASISAAGLTLTLNGLAVGSPITQFKPKFNLRGLGIQYESKGALSIGGALLRTTTINDKGIAKDEYSGAVLIKTEAFTLSAIASYTTTDDGHPSLFIYGVLDKPLGGPPFFFVTGLALGFAYNRSLILPTLDEIPTFPLVRAALEGSKADVAGLIQIQQDLNPHIPPRTGQVMLAIGVKFTSFKIIDSFILLIATFGEQFALDVIGISTLTSPPVTEATKNIPPIAQIRLAILARFVPAEGTLKVDGKILPDSFLFERNCQISGGFAFYSWFKGEHEGDFVLTVGGYHPGFAIPAHYPKVDPLSLNWRINNELTIKGSVYFALTASCIMAGGRLEAVWQSGDLKAWFIANAHFIVAWKPYFYDAQISLNLGASYTFDEKILGIRVRKTFSFDLGASLHIWGPEFSGTATIDLKITSFTIAFGNRTQQRPAPISWSEFKQSFLPPHEQVCAIAVESGLLRKVERKVGNENKKEEIFIVNPKDFTLITSSVIPIKHPKSLNQNPSISTYNLNLTSSSTGKKLPEQGNQLIAVYQDSQDSQDSLSRLEFRIFNLEGTKVIDLKEAELVSDTSTQEKLKNLLKPHWDKKITAEDKNKVIDAVTSITGYTPLSLNQNTTSGVIPSTDNFGIAPMSVINTRLAESEYSISITKVGGDIPEKALVGVPINKNVPSALWGIFDGDDPKKRNDPNQQQFIENVLSGYQIKPSTAGTLGATQPIDQKNLAYHLASAKNQYQWQSFSAFQKSKILDENEIQGVIQNTIKTNQVVTARKALLESLGLSDTEIKEIDLDNLNTNEGIEQAFVISPQLQLAKSSP